MVVGTVVRLGEQPFEVIGVLEPGFELLYPPGINVEPAPDVWTPLTRRLRQRLPHQRLPARRRAA